MKKHRRKIIITAGILAAVLALCTVMVCGGSTKGNTVRKEGQEIIPETVAAEPLPEEETRPGSSKDTVCTAVPETTVHEETGKRGTTAIRRYAVQEMTESTVAGFYEAHLETESAAVWDTTEYQETQPWSEPETTAHVHSYALADTRQVQHPAVTEQVWVEDTHAWDEVIRNGYHVCVVTCHECGAQFSDPAQANALEAWGNHIDAAHDGDGGYDMAASYDVPPEVIHHEASGHYETKTITPAWTEYIDTYRCSCGDAYTQTR